MIIDGSTLEASAVLSHLRQARNDPSCDEIDLRDIDFDNDETMDVIDLIRCRTWRSVKIIRCSGLLNDVVTACMCHKVVSFYLESLVNSQTIYGIAFGLKYSETLKHLAISIHFTEEHSTLLAKALARNSNLEHLSLAGSTLDPKAVLPLAFALRLNQTLKSMSLDGCQLRDEQVANLLLPLQTHPSLKALSLQQNECHTLGMAEIATLLHLNKLVDLDLSYLTRKKKTEQTLKAENLQDEGIKENKHGADDESTVSEKESCQAEEHHEGRNDDILTKENAKQSDNKSDVQVSDSDNAEDGKVHNTSLKVLQLAGNGLNDEYVSSLLNVFGKDSSLEEINLFGNRISDQGIKLIVRKLPQLKRLRSLWLGYNSFGPIAARDLVAAVGANFVLEDVSIRFIIALLSVFFR